MSVSEWGWLAGSAALSALLFMGLWAMWLKTREYGFKNFAFILAPIPLGLMLLILSFRSGDEAAVAGYFHVTIEGSSRGKGIVTREVSIPVIDATAPYSVQIDPVITDVALMSPSGQDVKASHGVIDEKRIVLFTAVGEGSYRLVLRVPESVDEVHITSMQNR